MSDFLLNPWNWCAAYLAIGMSICAYTLVEDWLRKCSRNDAWYPPFLEANPVEHKTDYTLRALAFITLVLFWLPGGAYFLLSDYLEKRRNAREAAWLETLEGKAEAEREYREEIEQELKPWIGIEDLMRRNVARSELDADYQECQNLFQRDRDVFEAFLVKIQTGDEIACFSTSEETWRHMHGRAGWALVRDGQVIAQLVTVMN